MFLLGVVIVLQHRFHQELHIFIVVDNVAWFGTLIKYMYVVYLSICVQTISPGTNAVKKWIRIYMSIKYLTRTLSCCRPGWIISDRFEKYLK